MARKKHEGDPPVSQLVKKILGSNPDMPKDLFVLTGYPGTSDEPDRFFRVYSTDFRSYFDIDREGVVHWWWTNPADTKTGRIRVWVLMGTAFRSQHVPRFLEGRIEQGLQGHAAPATARTRAFSDIAGCPAPFGVEVEAEADEEDEASAQDSGMPGCE